MEAEPFSKDERDELLRNYNEAQRIYNQLMDQEKFDEADKFRDKAKRLSEEYFQKVPRLTVSCCPFDGKPLIRTFDPYGLDGLWWQGAAMPEELPTCTHFCLMLGAVRYNDLPPRAGNFEVRPGPEVPYVLPRLLEFPGMVAVISTINMENGYTAYPIAYFAEKRPPVNELTAGWARTMYLYKTQLGEDGWKIPNDIWDFDLKAWLTVGKIRWCPPDSDNALLSSEPFDRCPYLDLPGERQRIVVQEDRFWTTGLPDGELVGPMD
ncbi:MAG: hypothetical protein WAV28_17250 [Sedimentisphaerales bacterium]|jgi:hypothetical protein